MNIGLVSSLFGDRMEQFALSAPENTLARGLEQNGHIVHRFPSGALPEVPVDVYHANFFCEAQKLCRGLELQVFQLDFFHRKAPEGVGGY